MYTTLLETIQSLDPALISEERKEVLLPLIDYIREKKNLGQPAKLNFICTHNSRRSHLTQVWAQAAAAYFGIQHVACYSGGTEVTALYSKVIETLAAQGFNIQNISEAANPLYAIRYNESAPPIIGFSKTYDNPFNPSSGFAAIMTCSQADGGCPFIAGAEKRISIMYEDPKTSDGTPNQDEIYAGRSLQIANEMLYIFSEIAK